MDRKKKNTKTARCKHYEINYRLAEEKQQLVSSKLFTSKKK